MGVRSQKLSWMPLNLVGILDFLLCLCYIKGVMLTVVDNPFVPPTNSKNYPVLDICVTSKTDVGIHATNRL